MKLYTEKQLQVAYDQGNMDGRLNNIDYSITDLFAPITLPSDEEIDKEKFTRSSLPYDWALFVDGAKWMREKILNK